MSLFNYLKKIIRGYTPFYWHPVKVQGSYIRGLHLGILWHGIHEPDVTALIKRVVKPGMVAGDLGACFGYHSLLMAHQGANVYAFEPDPANFKVLMKNIWANEARITALNAGVDTISGLQTFFSSSNQGTSSLFTPTTLKINEKIRTIQVLALSLDSIGIPFDFLKIDVEGAELKVLRGMPNLLRRGVEMTLEFSPRWFHQRGENPQDFLDELKGLGIRYAPLQQDGTPKFTTDEDILATAGRFHINLYATSKK